MFEEVLGPNGSEFTRNQQDIIIIRIASEVDNNIISHDISQIIQIDSLPARHRLGNKGILLVQ